MSLLNEILIWTETLPDWQRDAARRLLQKESGLSEEDYSELYSLLKASHGLPSQGGLSAIPLAAEHLPSESESGEAVTLKAMRELSNVNRIATDQTLNFGETGVTVIYGGNGSGKSGYARVLKRACRARDQQEIIHPNAQNSAARYAIPSAKFDIEIAAVSEEISWFQGRASPDKLSTIAVFDSRCARSYLTAEQDVAYLPYGLDIIENLANKVLPELSNRLGAEVAAINIDTKPFEHLWGDTEVGRQISTLTERSDAAQIEKLGIFSDEENKRLEDLTKSLAEADPIAKARELELSVARFKELGEKVIKPLAWVSDKAIEKLQQLDKAVIDAEVAEKKAAEALQSGETLLDGTGEKSWKLLFESARKYSTEIAYPEHEFPHIKDSVCPLCQESLGEDAGKRLNRFEQYVKDDVAKVAEEERNKLEVAKVEIEKSDVRIGLDAAISDEVRALDESLITIAITFEKSVGARRESMLAALKIHDWSGVPNIEKNPRAAIRTLAGLQLRSARTFYKAADPERKKILISEQSELSARENLSKNLEAVLALIQRMKDKKALDACKQSLRTRPISDKSKEFASIAVTQELKSALDREFSLLGVGHIKTILKERNDHGKMLHRLVLDLPTATKIEEILSEGEQRAIALGSFLAELTLANHSCGIVFDDPVSSLDHKRRSKVAKRFVQESQKRQVIIFTHDVVFLHQLRAECDNQRVEPTICFLESIGSYCGKVTAGLPWGHKSFGERIDVLEKEQGRLERLPWPADPTEAQAGEIIHQYNFLRATVERVVQDCILNGTVQRFRDYINVKKLDGVVAIEQCDVEEVLRLMQRCHNIIDAHDPASAKDDAPPTPVELKQDIDALRALIQSIKDKRSGAATMQGNQASPS